jgi:hypothetical protein
MNRVEQVTIEYPDGEKIVTPDLSCRKMDCSVTYINNLVG